MKHLLILLTSLFGAISFTAGQQSVLFSNQFTVSDTAQSPKNWFYNGRCEVTTLSSHPGYWLKLHGLGSYLPQLDTLLPEAFQVDFDFVYHAGGSSNNITELTLFTYGPNDELDVLYPGSAGVRVNFENFVISYLCFNNATRVDTVSRELRTDMIKDGEITPISVQVYGLQIKIWVHRKLLFTVPRCMPNTRVNGVRFQLRGSEAEPWIGNFRIVKN